MKMTTQEFLDHLGIEVGKDYLSDGVKIEVRKEGIYVYTSESHKFATSYHWLLDKEITPLPKYTLTEDEKKLVSIIPEAYKWVARDFNSSLWAFTTRPDKNNEFNKCWGVFQGGSQELLSHLLTFVKWSDGEPVSLDELRECL